MRKLKLFKTLLVAAGLTMGASSTWAQIVTWTGNNTSGTTYVGGSELSSNTDVVEVQLGATGETWASWYNSKTWGGIRCNEDTKTPTLDSNNIPTAGTFLKITPKKDLKFYFTGYCSNNFNPYITVVTSSGASQTKLSDRPKNTYTVDCSVTYGKFLAGNIYYVYGGAWKDSNAGINFGFQSFTVTTYENYIIHYVDNHGTTIKDDVEYIGLYGAEVTASEGDMASIEYGGSTYGYKSGNETITLGAGTNEITLVYETASVCNYTIKYVDGDNNSIADDAVVESVVGAEVTASGEKVPTYIWKDDVKYKYASGNTAITLTGDAATDVITLVYAEAAKYSYAVKTSYGDVIYGQEGTAYENETITYYWAAVMNNNGILNTANAVNNAYKGTFVLDSDNKEITISYTASTTITSLVFLNEGENIFTKGTGSTADTRGSMGAGGYQNSAKGFVTLDPGKYVLVLSNRCSGERTDIHIFKAGTGEDAVTIFSAPGNGYNATRTSDEFTLMKSTTIYFEGGSDNQWVDWLYIYKTGDVTVSVPVGTTGFATYANHDYALDFTNVSGLTAFTATVNGNEVTFTPATKVPAGTGVLLKGATADVPVIASADAISDNILFAPTANVTGLNYDADDYYNYILTQPSGKEVGFYRANNNSVAAGKAYLRIAQSAGARQFTFIGLNDETTGIKAINTTEQKNGEVYNLQGQRMAKTQKGLFIVNGKKVIMK